MIQVVIFDIDNTLYSYDAAHEIAFRAVTDFAAETFGLSAPDFHSLHRKSDTILRSRVGSVTAAIHNRLIRYQILLEELGRPLAFAPQMAKLYWSAFLAAMQPGPGLEPCFAFLKENGYRIGVGTNMTADYQYEKLERLGILGDMDFIVSSEEVGAEKPERRLFDCCVAKSGWNAENCLFVGDSLENDLLGAQAAGLPAAWLCSGPEDPPDGVRKMASLAELPGLLVSFI